MTDFCIDVRKYCDNMICTCGDWAKVRSPYFLLRFVAAELRPLLMLWRASFVFFGVWGLKEVQAEERSARPPFRPRLAALEPSRDFTPLPAMLDMLPTMLAVDPAGVSSASPLSGIVLERAINPLARPAPPAPPGPAEKGSPNTSDRESERWLSSTPLGPVT